MSLTRNQSESRMREICTSGSMSGERKRDEGIMPALPRLSSTLLLPQGSKIIAYRGTDTLVDVIAWQRETEKLRN